MKKELIYIRVPLSKEVYQEVQALAEATGRTVPRYVRQVLRRFLEYRRDAVEPRDYFRLGGFEEP